MIAIFLFYNKASGKQARLAFSKEFKHCEVICYDGDMYLLVRLTGEGIAFDRIKANDCARLVRNLKVMKELIALISVSIDSPQFISWKPFWIRSCNELSRYCTGVNVGLTWNPSHLYKKLIKYDRIKNYQILHAWRR